ncbi:MAG: hypothetical protein ACTS27_10935, partial [Phycisphaerales bacterium]
RASPWAWSGAASSAEMDGARVEAAASPSRATVADLITLRIDAHASNGATVTWPSELVSGDELGGMAVVEIRDMPPRIDAEGLLVESRELTLEPFLPGEAVIGPLRFEVVRADGTREALTLDPVRITIESLLPDSAGDELAGPKDVVDPPVERAAGATPWIVGGTLALALGAAAATLLVTRRMRGGGEVSARQRALAALAMLDDRVRGESSVGRRPSNREAYAELSAILRDYIEERFAYRATSRTTDEFLRDAAERRAGLPADAVEQLRGVLEACDEVKFGGAEPGMAAAAEALDRTRAFVDEFSDREAEEGA